MKRTAPLVLAASVLVALAFTGGGSGISVGRAVLLGAVEGATEFLPVSSTGHLVLADHLVAGDHEGRAATEGFLVVVQAGAIAAVLHVYRRRIAQVATGLRRDGDGRRIGRAIALAALPALLAGALAAGFIKDQLLEPTPVAVALALGGAAILACGRWYRRRELDGRGLPLEQVTTRTALLIGAAQVLALWPGISRSLVTILAGVAAGLGVAAAVEFSFLLGAVVLAAATGYELVLGTGGAGGAIALATGLVTAFATATVSVRWLVGVLARRDLRAFGWYRLGLAAFAGALLAAGVLHR